MKSEDDAQIRLLKPPMTDAEFHNFLDPVGHMIRPEEFRMKVYQGGIEPSLRSVVWRHLLNIFPEGLSGRERFEYIKRKSNEYYKHRDQWKELFSQGKGNEEIKFITNMVKKDVLRTDRTHSFYEGLDDNQNILTLFNILVTYALTHPAVSYCQGMSDIASPLLVVQKDEAAAYLCFCGLMKRLESSFSIEGTVMSTKFQHLALLLQHRDPEFYAYLKSHDAHDMFFCYRWLLLELKREFPFDDALLMLEVMWSSLPPDPPEEELALADPSYSFTRFTCAPSPASPSLANHAYSYLRLRSIRRQTSGRLKLAAETNNTELIDSQNDTVETNKLSTSCSMNVNKPDVSSSMAITPMEEEKDMDLKDFLPVSDVVTQDLMDKSNSIAKSLEGMLSSGSTSGPESIESSMMRDSLSTTESDEGRAWQNTEQMGVSNGIGSLKTQDLDDTSGKDKVDMTHSEELLSAVPPGSPRRPTDIPLKNTFEPAGDDSIPVQKPALVVGKDGVITERTMELKATSDLELNSCEEVTENHPGINFVKVNEKLPKLPPPHEFGNDNPFLIFLCLTLLVQQRDHIIRNRMDYNDLAMHFDKMVRRHNVHKVLHQAQSLYAVYLRAQANNQIADSSSSDDVSV